MRDEIDLNDRRTLRDLFQRPDPPIRFNYLDPQVSPDIMGLRQPEPIPPPQALYHLGAYFTPFRALFRRPRNTISG
ncbi:hypothetical protein SOP85_31075 [Pseudomonas sp. YuFO20]|uniref:hypothetical protein n=1 Tax=Bacteria TaxID=2 RepID=UPI002B240A13|nr:MULTISPECIES: hypothetical protein [Bacteria]MEB2519822.1 hypothetical protein [Pseudomonas sp. YuFO20]MEB2538397.1 hypothetical protein [Micrococcus luteus]MEB2597942.1 hypothetical protein [Corynebacterium amycolatum]MEB2616575.1 hypothetical protein [Bacillus cereus]MEB2619762.1 hypothetical protein [Kocuria rosea]